MKKISKALVAAGALTLSAASFAGGPAPAPALQGFYAGLGAAYNSVDVRFKNPLNIVSGGTTVPFSPYTEHRNFLSPMVQLGWISAPVSQAMGMAMSWGVKGFYKYLGLHTSNLAIVSTRAEHEVAGLLTLDFQVTHSAYAYVGAGFVVFPRVNNTLGVPGASASSKRTLWGGIGQVGMLYHIAPNWFVDASYSYAASSKKAFSNTLATTPAVTVNRNIQVVNQEVAMTMNYLVNL